MPTNAHLVTSTIEYPVSNIQYQQPRHGLLLHVVSSGVWCGVCGVALSTAIAIACVGFCFYFVAC
jgi:hypothetical protein